MEKKAWRRHHKWFGAIAGFFLVMFCWSGIVLNHRDAVSGVDIPRTVLPPSYRYSGWNGGLARGSVRLAGGRELIFGNAGVWSADSLLGDVRPMNEGFGSGVDMRNVRSMAVYRGDRCEYIFALTTRGLFALGNDSIWENVQAPFDGERLTDMELAADTLVVLSRSRAYVADVSGGREPRFSAVDLPAADGQDSRVTLFRTLWELHSGHLFGMVGRIVVDLVAVALIIIYFTGLAFWIFSSRLKRGISDASARARVAGAAKHLLSHHDSVGRKTIVLTLLVCLTGWCLRPPLMVPAVLTRVAPIPHTSLAEGGPWADKLRSIRYDTACADWLLSTSDGFFSMRGMGAKPERVDAAPQVSVMGINVWRRGEGGEWLVGSFRGLYRWSREAGLVTDYFDGRPVDVAAGGPPVGEHDVCGWLRGPVEYTAGTQAAPMPAWLAGEPMSLWNVALEVHTGRIYTLLGRYGSLMWVFVAGAAAAWAIWTGWKLRRRS